MAYPVFVKIWSRTLTSSVNCLAVGAPFEDLARAENGDIKTEDVMQIDNESSDRQRNVKSGKAAGDGVAVIVCAELGKVLLVNEGKVKTNAS
jgi:hypothetical protein